MGGLTLGTSVKLYSIDVDSTTLNQVVGGETDDSTLHGFSPSGIGVYYPLIAYIESQYGLKKWAKVYQA